MILTIGESRPKKWKIGAAGIKAVEGTDHTHSFVSWVDPLLDIRKVAEARGGGGRMVCNSQFRKENHIVRVFQYEIAQERASFLEKWLWLNMVPYGYKHLGGLFLMRIEGIFTKNPRNRMKSSTYSQVCVGLTATAIQIALGVDLPGEIDDYGLREMHDINMQNARNKLCYLGSDELLEQINAG